MIVRDAVASDLLQVRDLAASFDLRGIDSVQNDRYVALLQRHGRLLVAERNAQILGFGGVVHTGTATMITDLFVDSATQDAGVGGAILDALVAEADQLMTFSSQHPAAQRLYRGQGLAARWSLQYMEGFARPLPSRFRTIAVDASSLQIDRPEIAELLEQPLCLHLLEGDQIAGAAIVAIDERGAYVYRLVSGGDPADAVRAVISAFAAGAPVRIEVRDATPGHGALLDAGFVEIECDTFMSRSGVDIAATVIGLNPGLA